MRKHGNWLELYKDWCAPRSESPVTFIVWSGLFAIAAAVRKNVLISKRYMGGYSIYPNLYVVLVAPPGIRKTTTMSYADDILSTLGDTLPSAPTLLTQAALMTAMVETKEKTNGAIYVTASELASLIQKSKTEMFEFLTDAYDTRKPLVARTIGRGTETVEEPCLNLFACTQPSWIAENMPPSVIGGGFAARTIFVYEEQPRRRQLYYTDLNHDVLDKYRDNLAEDLAHIAMLKGEFEITEEARDFMEPYYVSTASKVKQSDPRIQSYVERKHLHAHKVAMLVSLSYKDDLVLTKADFEVALKFLGMIEPKMVNVFSNVGKNEYSVDMDAIREYIYEQKRVERSLVYRTFQAYAQPGVLSQLIEALKIMEYIKEVFPTGGEPYYCIPTYKEEL